MKYTVEIDILLPRERVIELFDNTDNMYKWQPGLVSFEHIEGEPGQEGAKSRLKYKMGKREIEMIETITKRDLPNEFTGTYEANGVWNEVQNLFKEENGVTKWTSHNEFRCTGFMKILMWLMPSSFKKQSLNYLKDFKKFAENKSIA